MLLLVRLCLAHKIPDRLLRNVAAENVMCIGLVKPACYEAAGRELTVTGQKRSLVKGGFAASRTIDPALRRDFAVEWHFWVLRRFVWNATRIDRQFSRGGRSSQGCPKGLALMRPPAPQRSPRGCRPRIFWPATLTAEGDSLPSRWREGRRDGWPPEARHVNVVFHTKRHRAHFCRFRVRAGLLVSDRRNQATSESA